MLRKAILQMLLCACTVAAAQAVSSQASVQIAPGVSVPAKGSVWVVYEDSTESSIQLYRSPAKTNQHWAKNLAGSAAGSFLYRPSMSIEIHGEHAETRLKPQKMVFYIREAATFEGEDDLRPGTTNDSLSSELALVRLKTDKGKRVEESISTNGFGRDAKRKVDAISMTRDKLDSGWLRLTPAALLEPGEYAIVPLPHPARYFSEFAYDFGIDPK